MWLQGSGRGLIGILSRHLAGGSGEKHDEIIRDGWCLSQDSNGARPEQEARAFLLDQLFATASTEEGTATEIYVIFLFFEMIQSLPEAEILIWSPLFIIL